MKNRILFALFIGIAIIKQSLLAQGFVHAGANIVMTDGAFIVIDGATGNYEATGNATIAMQPNSRIKVFGNWTNKGNTTIFTSNDGKIEFTGGNQSIGGSKITHFPDLALVGTGTKNLLQSTLVGGGFNGGGNGILRLNSNVF